LHLAGWSGYNSMMRRIRKIKISSITSRNLIVLFL